MSVSLFHQPHVQSNRSTSSHPTLSNRSINALIIYPLGNSVLKRVKRNINLIFLGIIKRTAIIVSQEPPSQGVPMAPLRLHAPVAKVFYQPSPIVTQEIRAGDEATSIKPPGLSPRQIAILALLPTRRGEPLAAVIKISPSCTKSVVLPSFANTSSLFKTN